LQNSKNNNLPASVTTNGAANIVTLFFRPDQLFRDVEAILKSEGVLAESITSGIFRGWHTEAWRRRFEAPTIDGRSFQSSLTNSDELTQILMSADRVFVRPQPIRELLSYVAWLEVFATQRLALLPSNLQLVFLRNPHYPYELTFSSVAARFGHQLYTLDNVMGKRIALSTVSQSNWAQPKWIEGSHASTSHLTIDELVDSDQHKYVRSHNMKKPYRAALADVGGIFLWLLLPSVLGNRLRHRLNRKNQVIFSRPSLFFRLLEVMVERRRIRRLLSRVEVRAPRTHPYVLIPLHYQPERSTDPEAGSFSHQVRFVQRVREILNDSGRSHWALLLREHPLQLRDVIPGLGVANFRSRAFYRGLLSVPGTEFISSAADEMESLVQNSSLVATINGDAALEALRMGVPALTGRSMWFSACDAVEDVESATRRKNIDALLSRSPEEIQSLLDDYLNNQMILFGSDYFSQDGKGLASDAAEGIAHGLIARLRKSRVSDTMQSGAEQPKGLTTPTIE
jgi:hypothetical protein